MPVWDRVPSPVHADRSSAVHWKPTNFSADETLEDLVCATAPFTLTSPPFRIKLGPT